MAMQCKIGLSLIALSLSFVAGRASVVYEVQRDTIAVMKDVDKIKEEVNKASDSVASSTNKTVNNYVEGVKHDEKNYHDIVNNIDNRLQQQTTGDSTKGSDCSISSNTRSNTTPSGANISRKDIENLIEIGKECNQVVRQLNACQSILLEYKALADSLDKNK